MNVTADASAGLFIGQMASRSGCSIETIRYYERVGLLPKPARTEGGHRVYHDAQARRLAFIRRARELGFTLDQVRTLLSLVDGHDYTCGQVRALTLEHLKRVRRNIADLRRLERVLDSMARECAGGTLPECPIIEALFEARDDPPCARRGERQGQRSP